MAGRGLDDTTGFRPPVSQGNSKFLKSRPRRHLGLAEVRLGLGLRVGAPRARRVGLGAQPPEHVPVPAVGRPVTRVRVPVARRVLRARPLQHAEVPVVGRLRCYWAHDWQRRAQRRRPMRSATKSSAGASSIGTAASSGRSNSEARGSPAFGPRRSACSKKAVPFAHCAEPRSRRAAARSRGRRGPRPTT